MQQYRIGEGPYGSAYQGTIDDLFGSGDLAPIEVGNRSFGLFLGQFDWQQTVSQTWEEPAKGIWAWFAGKRVPRKHTEVIPQVQDLRFTGDQHHLIVASSGAGKFRDVLSNMLLYDGSCDTACLVIDPKGEIASTTGVIIDSPDARDPRTVILDPWDLCGTGATDSLTLLDGIRADNPHCVKDARVLADAIIIERSSEDGHWVATAKNFLSALLLYLCLDPLEENERTLFRLRQIVTLPWSDLADLLGYMSDSNFFEGLVARAAQAMLNRDEKERRAILSTLERDTAFVEDPGLWKAIKTSSFDMNKLVLTNKRLHVIVPFDYTEQMSSWLRLTIAAFYNACLRSQLPPSFPKYLRFRHIIIDEFAGLGKLDFIMKGIAEARGAGIKYHIVVQNFPQLNMLYKEGWENLVSNSLIHAFGVNDNFTSEYLSKLTGQATVITESKGFSNSTTTGTSTTSGSSRSSGHGESTYGTSQSKSESFSTTTGTSVTFSSVGRPVLMPDEIRRLSNKNQLLFMREMPVIVARRTPYYETFGRFLPRHALVDVLRSAKLLGQQQRALVAYGPAEFNRQSPLVEVNSRLRVSGFVPPPYRPYTFFQALLQSPKTMAATAIVIVGLCWAIPKGLDIWQKHNEALEAANVARQERMDKQRELYRVAQEHGVKAVEIDKQLQAPYAAFVGNIYGTISRLGMCVTGNVNPAFSCQTLASYTPGDMVPISLTMDIKRQQYLSLAISPQNMMRNASFTGVMARMTIRSVFDHVDFNSRDEARFSSSIRAVLSTTLHAFNLPDQFLESCRSSAQGLSETLNGTTVSCHFTAKAGFSNAASELSLDLRRSL